MRIWILSDLYYPEQASTGYLLTKTAEGLAETYNVNVITGPASESFRKVSVPRREIHQNVEILRCSGTSFNKNSIRGRLLNLITRSVAIFWAALWRCKHDDLILVVTNPPLLPFVALLLSYLKRCKFVLLIHDVYPEAVVATEIVKLSSWLIRIGDPLNRLLYNRAARIITLGRDMSWLAKRKLVHGKDRIRCIPNWADHEIVQPMYRQDNPLLKQWGIAHRFVILYAGNLGRTHGIEYLAEAARVLRAYHKIHFVVVGFGAKKQWLETFLDQYQLQNITVLDSLPRSELNDLLNACDVGLISFVPGMAGVSVPSRMYNQMTAGKPLIGVTDTWSELAHVIQEERIGWVVRPGDIAGLVDAIVQAANNPTLCVQMGARAAAATRQKYHLEQANRAYTQLFTELFDETKASQ